MPAVIKIVGPGFLERSIITGTVTGVCVCNLARLKLTSLLSPNLMVSPKMCKVVSFFFVIYFFVFFSIKAIMLFAIFLPVADSMPSKPGVEFTSKSKGPLDDCNMSTPQTGNFKAFAA